MHSFRKVLPLFCVVAGVATVPMLLLPRSQADVQVKPPTKGEKAVAAASNAFAVELYQHLAGGNGNLFFSPHSLSTALAMTYAGARGRTAEQMASVLHFPTQQDQLHEPFSRTIQALNAIGSSGNCKLSVANALWGKDGEPFKQPFLELIKRFYEGDLTPLDFTRSVEAANRINSWASDHTEGKIKDLVSSDLLGRFTVLVLTNAIYFKGDWAAKFDKAKTQDRPFFVGPDAHVMAPTMDQQAKFRVLGWRFGRRPSRADVPCSLLELPYKGGHLSMVILLPEYYGSLRSRPSTQSSSASTPAADDPIRCLRDLERAITPMDLQRWLDDLYLQNPVDIHVLLPKFKLRWRAELKPVLKEMGMEDPFCGGADFSGITGPPGDIFISNVIHAACVDVNEEGTEAAAASAVILSRGGPPTFQADHPFLFLIRDNRTGAILFMGRVLNPVATD